MAVRRLVRSAVRSASRVSLSFVPVRRRTVYDVTNVNHVILFMFRTTESVQFHQSLRITWKFILVISNDGERCAISLEANHV